LRFQPLRTANLPPKIAAIGFANCFHQLNCATVPTPIVSTTTNSFQIRHVPARQTRRTGTRSRLDLRHQSDAKPSSNRFARATGIRLPFPSAQPQPGPHFEPLPLADYRTPRLDLDAGWGGVPGPRSSHNVSLFPIGSLRSAFGFPLGNNPHCANRRGRVPAAPGPAGCGPFGVFPRIGPSGPGGPFVARRLLVRLLCARGARSARGRCGGPLGGRPSRRRFPLLSVLVALGPAPAPVVAACRPR